MYGMSCSDYANTLQQLAAAGCMSTRDAIDRLRSQNAQLSANSDILTRIAPNPIQHDFAYTNAVVSHSTHTRKRFSGNCPHCGAPVNPHKAQCEYCDCYYE